MTQQNAIDRVRRLLDQTDTGDTQFSDTMIAELVNQGRRLFVAILPSNLFPNLNTGENTTISISGGYAAYPNDYLRRLENKRVLVDNVFADEIPSGEEWRIKYLESNDLTASGSTVKRYRETGTGIQVYPTSASLIKYPYLKKPTNLEETNNTELPADVEDMTVDFAFEKVMGTQRGDIELATFLAQSRGYILKDKG